MEVSREGQKPDGEKPRPVRVDTKIVGSVQFIVDGPTGKDGIQAKASRVRELDGILERGEERIRDLQNEIEKMSQGFLGEFVAPIQALFDGKTNELNRALESRAAFLKERREESAEVCKGIVSIEDFIDDYAKKQKEYQSAGKLQGMLRNMIVYSSLCGNAYASIERIRAGGGGAVAPADAEKLLTKNKKLFEEALAQYWGEVGQSPRWIGYMPFAFEPEDKHSAAQAKSVIEANLAKLTEKMKEYILEIKNALPNDIATHYLSDEKKEYFRERAKEETPNHDSPEVSEDNP